MVLVNLFLWLFRFIVGYHTRKDEIFAQSALIWLDNQRYRRYFEEHSIKPPFLPHEKQAIYEFYRHAKNPAHFFTGASPQTVLKLWKNAVARFWTHPRKKRGKPPLAKKIRELSYLKREVIIGSALFDKDRGITAANLRNLSGYISLADTFSADYDFMNENLRDFLNLNTGGTMQYKRDELIHSDDWDEIPSVGSQYHQTYTAGALNSKFVNNKDGREVVFGPTGQVIYSYPDKGTFNYGGTFGPAHNTYDVDPYTNLMDKLNISTTNRWYAGYPFGKNSELWSRYPLIKSIFR